MTRSTLAPGKRPGWLDRLKITAVSGVDVTHPDDIAFDNTTQPAGRPLRGDGSYVDTVATFPGVMSPHVGNGRGGIRR